MISESFILNKRLIFKHYIHIDDKPDDILNIKPLEFYGIFFHNIQSSFYSFIYAERITCKEKDTMNIVYEICKPNLIGTNCMCHGAPGTEGVDGKNYTLTETNNTDFYNKQSDDFEDK